MVSKTEGWDNKQLRIRDAERCLDFLDEVRRITSANQAGNFLKPAYQARDLTTIKDYMEALERQEHNFITGVPGVRKLTLDERRYLESLRKQEERAANEQDRMITACGPIKSFIDSHLDSSLSAEVREIMVSNEIPLYDQVRQSLRIIAEKCLGNPVETRKSLYRKLEDISPVRKPGHLLDLLDNMAIILGRIQIHYDTVTTTVDEAATDKARARNPLAPPIMKICQLPPTSGEKIAILASKLPINEPNMSPIIGRFLAIQHRQWNFIVAELKKMAENLLNLPGASGSSGGVGSGGPSSVVKDAAGKHNSSGIGTSGGNTTHLAAAASSVHASESGVGMKRSYAEAAGTDNNECKWPWDDQRQQCQWEIMHNFQCKYNHPRRMQIPRVQQQHQQQPWQMYPHQQHYPQQQYYMQQQMPQVSFHGPSGPPLPGNHQSMAASMGGNPYPPPSAPPVPSQARFSSDSGSNSPREMSPSRRAPGTPRR